MGRRVEDTKKAEFTSHEDIRQNSQGKEEANKTNSATVLGQLRLGKRCFQQGEVRTRVRIADPGKHRLRRSERELVHCSAFEMRESLANRR